MAFFGEGGGWYKKPKLWSGLMGGYLGDRNRSPQPNARFRQNPFPGMDDPNWSVSASFPAAQKGGGILDKFKDKKRWKHMVEALDKMKNAPIKPLAAGRNVGDSGIQYTPTDMGAYVGDPVARQRAMAEARRKKEKEGLMILLGGGY